MSSKTKTLVFAGPTLSGLSKWREARSDHYVFHGPVQCGNVLEAFREGFRRIVIVDGLFERVAAVWHKEIMLAIERGATVIGCSSMGALRAVELEPFGMLGFGKVVADFKSGAIADDDEVTVGHLGPAQDYHSLTDAMVNIRYTVADAVARGVLEAREGDHIISKAKAAFYKRRNLALFAREVLSGERLARFENHLAEHGLIDLKRADAVALLENLEPWLASQPAPVNRTGEPINRTVLIQNLQYLLAVNPPSLEKIALGAESRQLKMGRLLVGKQYHLLSILGGAIMHYSNTIKDREIPPLVPPPWLDAKWLDDKGVVRVLACALADCPEYATAGDVPMQVRYLAFTHAFPYEYLKQPLPEDDALTTNAVGTYSRLLYLIGLFLDARLCHDPVAQRVAPTEKATDLRMAHYTLGGYGSEDEQRELAQGWGLTSLRDAAMHLEIHGMLLSEVTTGVSFWFFEEGIYWYDLAIHMSGLWPQLRSLARPEVRTAFSRELAADLGAMPPQKRLSELLMAGLPPDLLSPESIQRYIAAEVDP